MKLCISQRALHACAVALCTGPLAAAAPQATRPGGYVHLAVVGFAVAPDTDPRDTWMAAGVEETLAWRLQRTPGLIVIPTVRAHQGRLELRDEGATPPEWPQVARLLGAQVYLTGTCGGSPDAVRLELRLVPLDDAAAAPETIRIGPVRLFAALDEATRWVMARLGAPPLDEQRRKLVLSPPCRSPSALEYYAKAILAAQAENLRDAAYYVAKSVEYDRDYRPGLAMLAQIDLRRGPRARAAVGAQLYALSELGRRANDARARAEAELTRGVLLRLSGVFSGALERYESALLISYEAGDPYGQVAAMDAICDAYLSRRVPPGVELSEPQRRQIRRQNYRCAAEWQRLVLDALAELGDTIAEVPAASKLALIYQNLGDNEAALTMHRRTLAAAQQTGSRRNEATAWMLLGQHHRAREQWQAALDATSRCLTLAPDSSKARVRIALASIYGEMKRWPQALGQYELALEHFRQTDDADSLQSQLVCLREIAAARMQMGERTRAVSDLQEALDIAHALRSPDEATLRERLEQWKRRSD